MKYISSLPSNTWSSSFPRSVCLLGSTGSIGRSALDVIERQPELFTVTALAGAKNTDLLARQAAAFRPPYLGVYDAVCAVKLESLLPAGYTPTIVIGQEGYEFLAQLPEVSTVLSAQVGAAGLRATYAAVAAGKVVALANKESLVLAGELIRSACAASGAVILPVDSEHNAIFQCLVGHAPHSVAKLVITASGGPFFGKTSQELGGVTPESALAHPNWSMGAKITIDSSTLMNKGLEVIEAYHLFGLPLSCIDVVVHRESIVHSLVEYQDGSLLAQMGVPDMRVAIAYALGWPERLNTGVARLDLVKLGQLSFAAPDETAFPCLTLAKDALRSGQGGTIVLNGANEVAVDAFLTKQIGYLDIARLVERSLHQYYGEHQSVREPSSIEDVLAIDAYAREYVLRAIKAL